MKWTMLVSVLSVCSLVFLAPVARSRPASESPNYIQRGSAVYERDASGHEWEVCPGRIIVRFEEGVSIGATSGALARQGLSLVDAKPLPGGGYRCAYDPERNPLAALAAIKSEGTVVRAVLDTYVEFFGPDDTYYSRQWGIARARVDKAWSITGGSGDVVIAVLDRGFEIGHEDLAGVVWTNSSEDVDSFDDDGNGYVDDVHGWDFKSNDNDPGPAIANDQHGTAVAGIVCAVRNNALGVAGVAGGEGGGALLVPVRVDLASDVSVAIDYAWRLGVDIINMSWGTGDPGGNVSAALDSADAHGVVLVAASGNADLELVFFPASHDKVIAVGSSDRNDERICTSSYGSELDIVAPSASPLTCPDSLIWTLDNYVSTYSYNPGYGGCGNCFAVPAGNDRYFGAFGNTSAASPFAAGVVALVMSHLPELTATEVRERLLASAIDVGVAGFDVEHGHGRVDAYRAVTEWGTIASNVTWSPEDTHDGVRYISGDLTIAEGATLTIMPGTIIRVADEDDLGAGADNSRVEINVEGHLIANGTEADPIVFASWNPDGNEDWVGVYIDSTSEGATFDNCIISRAAIAIESFAELTLTNTVIDTCALGVLAGAGDALIQGCQFNGGGAGVELEGGDMIIRTTTVDGVLYEAVAVFADAPASLDIRNSVFMNSEVGLFVSGDAAIEVDSSSYFYYNDTGIHFYDTGAAPVVRNSVVGGNTSTAILCDQSSHPLIDGNIIGFNGNGIYCSNSSSPVIKANSIQSSGNCVSATSSANPDVGHASPTGGQSPGNNNIAHTTGKLVANYNTSGTIYAENNCWNRNTGDCTPNSSLFQGIVDRSPAQCCEFERWDDETIIEPEFSEGFVFQLPPARKVPAKPTVTGLVSIVPNPFNPTTTIHYALAAPGKVDIKIYDVAGRLVQDLASGAKTPGPHNAVWNGIDRSGSRVASGVYFVRMVAAGQVFTKKMVMLK